MDISAPNEPETQARKKQLEDQSLYLMKRLNDLVAVAKMEAKREAVAK